MLRDGPSQFLVSVKKNQFFSPKSERHITGGMTHLLICTNPVLQSQVKTQQLAFNTHHKTLQAPEHLLIELYTPTTARERHKIQ